jgi:hypothetical protein
LRRRVNSELDEQRARLVLAGRLPGEVFQLNGQLEVVAELDGLSRPSHRLDRGEGVLAQLLLLDLAGVFEDAFERSEFRQQRRGGLLAHAGNAGTLSILSPVSARRSAILSGGTPLSSTSLGAVPLLVHRVVAADAVVDELEEVLVSGDDDNLESLPAGGAGKGGDDVVRLPSRLSDGGDVQRLEHPAHQGKLRREVFGHRSAGRLVLGVDLAARLLGVLVEADGDVRRLALADGLQEHGGEPVHRVGRDPLPGGEVRQRVVRAKDRVRPVHEPEGRHGFF